MGRYRNEQGEEAGPIGNSDLPGVARDRFTNALQCHHCGQTGAVVWEENALGHRHAGVQRRLVGISPGFQAQDGLTASGDPVIVCSNCDSVQPD